MIRVGSIVLRVDDLQRQTEFWEAALDYVRRESDSDDFVLLRPRDGIGPNLSLDRVRSTLQIPPRIHLDLYTDDQAGEVGLRHPRRSGGQPLLRGGHRAGLGWPDRARLACIVTICRRRVLN